MSWRRLNNSESLTESNFEYLFLYIQPLIFLKCLGLSDRYITRLQWEWYGAPKWEIYL